MKRIVAIALAWIFAANALADEALPMRVDGPLSAVVAEDLDGDGRAEIVAAYARVGDEGTSRKLRVFANGAGEVTLDVPGWAAAFDIANLGDGAAILFIGRGRVDAVRVEGGAAGESSRVATVGAPILVPDEERLPRLSLARNWRGGPETELLSIGLDRVVVLEKNGKGLAPAESLPLAVTGSMHGPSNDDEAAGALANVTIDVPYPALFDYDGDGATDLYVIAGTTLTVFRQEAGKFATKAAFRRDYEVRTTAERREGNVSAQAVVRDLDGDGRGDVIVNKFGGGLTNYRSQTRIFRGGAGGLPTTPTYESAGKGFSGGFEFPDADGDGCRDLVMPSVEVSVMTVVKMLTTSKVGIDYQLFYCGGPSLYALEPGEVRATTFRLDVMSRAGLLGTPPVYGHDFTGDGEPDALISPALGRLEVRERKGDAFAPEAAATFNAPPTGNVIVKNVRGNEKPDVILWYVDPEHEGEIRVFEMN
ncbi:VCBS repeat-containing protein [bacterium]|nr:VCBS repeat-containing protein [bacterium]